MPPTLLVLPLYCVQFVPNPETAGVSVAKRFKDRDPEELACMITDIERELARPTRPLNEVWVGPYDFAPGRDKALRDFLRGFVDALRSTIDKSAV